MLDQKEITVGKTGYTLQQLNTTSCLEIGISMIQIIAGAAEGFGDVPAGGGFLDIWVNPGKLSAGLMNKLDVTGTPQLIKRMVRESLMAPEFTEEWYEAEFSGELDNLFMLIEKIVELNRYPDLVKKRLPEIMGLISSVTDTVDPESIPSTSGQSDTASAP